MLFSNTKWKQFVPHPLTVLSGALFVLAFPPWNLWPLLWFCLVPWFWVVERSQTPKDGAIQGAWLGYCVSLGGFYWIAFAITEYGKLPWIISLIGLQIFCCFGQLQFIAHSFLQKTVSIQLKERSSSTFLLWTKVSLPAVFACTYTGLDWILPKLFHDTLGHGFYRATHLRQLADLGGAHLLTFIAFLTNFSLYQAYLYWKEKKGERKVVLRQIFLALLICISGWVYGFFRNQEVLKMIEQPQQKIQIAAIQANIGDINKLAAESGISEAADEIIDTFIELTNEALTMVPKPEAIVWPETAYPSTFRKPHTGPEFKINERIEFYSRQMGVPLLFGGYDEVKETDYNAFFYLSPKGLMQTYQKNILLLFGEYIPGAESIQWFKDTFPQVGNFGRGVGPEVLMISTVAPMNATQTAPVATSPVICYEVLFPYYLLQSARQGSQLIINITNDSWFGDWGEPQLHLALSTFRSIETRLPMLRSTNTGISALVLPNGEISKTTRTRTREIMNVSIPLSLPKSSLPTLLKKWGDWFGLFSLVFGFLSLGLGGFRIRIKREAA